MKHPLLVTVVSALCAVALSGCSDKAAESDLSSDMPLADLEPLEYPTTPIEPLSPDPAAVGETTYVDEPAGGSQTHTVRRGDTLWKLALRYYGDGQRWRDIAAANGGLEPTRLRVGQQLMVP